MQALPLRGDMGAQHDAYQLSLARVGDAWPPAEGRSIVPEKSCSPTGEGGASLEAGHRARVCEPHLFLERSNGWGGGGEPIKVS